MFLTALKDKQTLIFLLFFEAGSAFLLDNKQQEGHPIVHCTFGCFVHVLSVSCLRFTQKRCVLLYIFTPSLSTKATQSFVHEDPGVDLPREAENSDNLSLRACTKLCCEDPDAH